MTSKEALEIMLSHVEYYDEKEQDLYEKILKKDLEVLETLKIIARIVDNNINHVEMQIIDGYPTGNVFVGMTNDDLNALFDEINKIKEWLEK